MILIKVEDLDQAHWWESKYIGSIAVILNIIHCIEGSKLFKIDKVVNTDHRLYVIDINLEIYFDEEFSG